MEAILLHLLQQIGIPSVVAGLLYLIVSREAFHRGQKRDAQINALSQENKETKEEVKKHIEKHESFESEIYKELRDIGKIVYKIDGYLDGKNDKSK
ncbi:MAG: hypothetical protein LBC75_02675 [Fibromonadaceae bacterium]|jgi:cell division protein FtsB|nr:hypothetical protein [Fibromonadaceae bacterium]